MLANIRKAYMHLTGWMGIVSGVVIFVVTWMIVSSRTPNRPAFKFETTPGAFEKILAIYLDIAKFILGLAAGGIVLVIGSSALGQTKKLPTAYADPLFVLAVGIFYGLVFMPLITLNYESFKNGTEFYSRRQYIRNRALGYASLACFCIGYGWIIYAAVIG
jgi:hypothetical protein